MSYIIETRRKLHTYPEIGFELPKTIAFVKNELDRLGVAYTEQYGKSSIVATINEEKSAFTIGIRADMDALPVTEKTDCSFKSKIKGQMHACGHDAHTAILLDTIRRLADIKDKLNCRVKFVFQAAEEYKTPGAPFLVKDGVMDNIDCMIALHVDPTIETGKITVAKGAINAVDNVFTLDFYGKSTHVARQEKGVDAISMAVKAYTAIEFMIAKELPYDCVRIFNVGSINGGIANNIICDHTKMYCSLRTYDEETADFIIKRIKQIITYTAKTSNGRAKYTHLKYLPIVNNDEKVADRLLDSAKKIVGKNNILDTERTTIGEDFAFYSQVKPCCMYFLGVRNEEKDCVYALHQDKFNVDEDALKIGSDIFVQFVLDNMDGLK